MPLPAPSASTIAAIATAPGRGAVGIVRVSGPEAEFILRRLAPTLPDAPLASHHLQLTWLRDAQGRPLDQALVVLMRGPHSYTGEDVVEFHCHGGPTVLRRVLDAALTAGARPAAPGAFTERAFLRGRLDLIQAEAIADLIGASTEAAHRQALEHLEGGLGQEIEAMRNGLAEALVLVEAAIDFAHEEHVYQIESGEVGARLAEVLGGLRRLRESFDQGRRRREGVRVVILGPPNAGKSTLFNALCRQERAIVTPIAGTTRDWLEEEIALGQVSLRLVDTAGLRQGGDIVEEIGIARSRELAQTADLVIWLLDRQQGLDDTTRHELDALHRLRRPLLVVLQKADLPSLLSTEDRRWLQDRFPPDDLLEAAVGAVPQPQGMDVLLNALERRAQALVGGAGEGTLLSRARHLDCVVRAIEALGRAQQAVEAGLHPELVALDLREGLDAVGEVVGRVSPEDVLRRIFSEFCVGK